LQLRQLAVFFILLGIVFLVRLPFGPLGEPALQRIADSARESGVPMQIGGGELEFPSTIHLEQIGALVPLSAFPFPLAIESFRASLNLGPLLTLRSAVPFESALYGGTLKGKVDWPLVASRFSFDAAGEHLDLGRHPAFQAFGLEAIADLRVSFQGDRFAVDRFPIDAGEITFRLSRGVLPGGLKLPPGIPLPAASDIEGEIKGRQAGPKFQLESLELNSSLGSVSGSGSFDLSVSGAVDTADAEFSIQLTEEGRKKVGGYLALAARRPPDSPDRNWSAALDKKKGAPLRWTVRAEP
jgi:type II secretion system protein N